MPKAVCQTHPVIHFAPPPLPLLHSMGGERGGGVGGAHAQAAETFRFPPPPPHHSSATQLQPCSLRHTYCKSRTQQNNISRTKPHVNHGTRSSRAACSPEHSQFFGHFLLRIKEGWGRRQSGDNGEERGGWRGTWAAFLAASSRRNVSTICRTRLTHNASNVTHQTSHVTSISQSPAGRLH